jgi:hypothetical protein
MSVGGGRDCAAIQCSVRRGSTTAGRRSQAASGKRRTAPCANGPAAARTIVGTSLATVTGQPLTADAGLARILEVVLAVYSVAVFATLAGS